MARLCERPGCSQPAEALYGMSAEQLTVWLKPYDVALATRVGVLCRRHADAMVVPLGWMLEDWREPVPRLFKTRAVLSEKPMKPKRRTHRPTGDDTGQLELVVAEVGEAPAPEELVPVETVEPPVEVADNPVAPWRPVFDQRSDLDGLLDVRSPLLSRAFRGHSNET
ncbi:MAG: DUF3499 family protein [Actinobacteria bacterium]|uniref:Unannotated protein n=1 Tax=freshwater metagenome TaxID=449393 RepID=A0A6J7BWA3_9ZZZZ|nr:DUF3499 family protein [Actinomycetota bacterium]MSW76036.1 DUF3499 family protein [Actinomycetota bacterium]MSX54506.1 DUF3499 family protein [Actinomycetota bacterium]MSX93240.1 DUF3499 family protein [Actinomycetota bacterium]MSZ84660.1 DUF3499 family protein [Actinomycetota bacterium]